MSKSMDNETAVTEIMKMRLTAIIYAAQDINIFELSPLKGEILPVSEAGSHIGVRLIEGLDRQYSLFLAEEKPTSYKIAVKKDAHSRGGSTYMHEKLPVGTVLDITMPCNNFKLDEEAKHTVLVAGGIGITPIYSMMMRLKLLKKTWEIHYSCRSREDALFLDEFIKDDRVHLYFDDERGGDFLPLNDIITGASSDTHFYCCGPVPMLGAFEDALSDYPSEQIHVEYFTAKEQAATEGGYVVELAQSGIEINVPEGTSILHVLLEQDINISYSCEEGACGMCEVRVIEGIPDHRDAILTDREREENETMMVCCSGSKSDRLILDL